MRIFLIIVLIGLSHRNNILALEEREAFAEENNVAQKRWRVSCVCVEPLTTIDKENIVLFAPKKEIGRCRFND